MIKRIRIDLKEVVGRGKVSTVLDADTGEPLTNVRSIKIEAGFGRVTTVMLELVGVEVQGLVEGNVAIRTTALGDSDGHERNKVA